MALWYVIAAAVIAFIATSIYHGRALRRYRQAWCREIISRPSEDQDVWFRREIEPLGVTRDAALALLKPIAAEVGCDITQLRAADSFSGSLQWRGPAWAGIIDDDNPWDDFFECSFKAGFSDEDQAHDVLFSIWDDPTLAALVTGAVAAGFDPVRFAERA